MFALLSQPQIAEFKEAFTLIDRDADGFIQKQDLLDILNSLGQTPDDEYLEEMLDEASGNINFTMFLTMMGERINESEFNEERLLDAFKSLDEKESGVIPIDFMREMLTGVGEKLTETEFIAFTKGFLVNSALQPQPGALADASNSALLFDYRKFLSEIKGSA